MKLSVFGDNGIFTVDSLTRLCLRMRLMKVSGLGEDSRRLMKLSAFGEDGEGHKLDTLSANFLPK
jgi:hypothetical protein